MHIIQITEPDTPLNDADHVGSFNYMEFLLMDLKKQQSALTVEDQIKNLISLGLIVEDEDFAKRTLNDISYFRLVKAFSLGLKPKNGKYYDGITFGQLVDLYKFNCNFRHAIFPIIERIEVNLRCLIANYFSSKYGVLGYENPNNFTNAEHHAVFLCEIEREINRNAKSPFVNNFINKYEDSKIPMYALIELFSFGMLSKFFRNMKNFDKKEITATYHIPYTYFESWIESIAYVRNVCAHYGRLYNSKLSKTPMLYSQYTKAGIGNIRIFGVLLCMHHLVPHDIHWDDFISTIELLIEKYDAVDITTMGFPGNWKELLSE